MKSSKKLQISSYLLFVYINNQDRKWRMSVLVFSSALVLLTPSRVPNLQTEIQGFTVTHCRISSFCCGVVNWSLPLPAM